MKTFKTILNETKVGSTVYFAKRGSEWAATVLSVDGKEAKIEITKDLRGDWGKNKDYVLTLPVSKLRETSR